MRLVKLNEVDWESLEGYDITCVNHPTAKYYSKNPWTRSLHFLEAAEGFGYMQECPCEFTCLRVVLPDA